MNKRSLITMACACLLSGKPLWAQETPQPTGSLRGTESSQRTETGQRTETPRRTESLQQTETVRPADSLQGPVDSHQRPEATATGRPPKARLILPIGHTGEVYNARFSPDGRRVVTNAADSTAKIWDARTGMLEASLRGHGDLVFNAHFSADGKAILSLSLNGNGNVRIWDATTGEQLVSLVGNELPLEYRPDGRRMVTAYVDSLGRIREAASGKWLASLKGWSQNYWAGAASPDGKLLIGHSGRRPAGLWDLSSGELIRSLSKDSAEILETKFAAGVKRKLVETGGRAAVRDPASDTLVTFLKDYGDTLASAVFSPGGERMVMTSLTAGQHMRVSDNPFSDSAVLHDTVLVSFSNEARLWDAVSGRLIATLAGHSGPIWRMAFSDDGARILTLSDDNTVKIWDAGSGRLLADLRGGHSGKVTDAQFSPDGTRVVTASYDGSARIWSTETGREQVVLRGHAVEALSVEYSPDGSRALLYYRDGSIKIWNMETGRLSVRLKGPFLGGTGYSPDGRTFVTATPDAFSAELRDAATGKVLRKLMPVFDLSSVKYSPDGKRIFLKGRHSGKIWELATGRSFDLRNLQESFDRAPSFSPDGKKLLVIADESAQDMHTRLRILDVATGRPLASLARCKGAVFSTTFSPDGRKLIVSFEDSIGVWDAQTGLPLAVLPGNFLREPTACFSPDGRKIIVLSFRGQATETWDAVTYRLLDSANITGDIDGQISVSPDGRKIAVLGDNSISIRDAHTGQQLSKLEGHESPVNSLRFSPDGRRILTCSSDNTCKLWDAATGSLFYTFFAIDTADYLVIDPEGRYDGTERARKLLYYTCGTEIIELEQLKALSWEPDLAAKILGTLHEAIGARSTASIELCDYTPLVAEADMAAGTTTGKPGAPAADTAATPYRYTITPRRGGIGEVQLFVNNKQIRTYRPDQAIATAGRLSESEVRTPQTGEQLPEPAGRTPETASRTSQPDGQLPLTGSRLSVIDGIYRLSVSRDEVAPYFSTGEENRVIVKATTRDGYLSSRGIPIFAKEPAGPDTTPNPDLYILAIGISKYTGEAMRLHYAGKDAADFCRASAQAARRLLNTRPGDHDHVHEWAYETEEGSTRWPAKSGIRKIFDTIASRAGPNDILLLFFAGHGGLRSGETNYYLLTAEAESFDQLNSIPREVAISTEELDSLMRSVKAAKQILILDACNSGQAVKNLQDLIVRREVPADQQRALEKLKDKTGTFILSASAADQSAYETTLYGQGLLTYSLLARLKYGDGLRDAKYVDVSRWFNTSSDGVRELMKDIRGRQDPQILEAASFDIGMVDRAVADSIHLSLKKKIFVRSLLIGDEQSLSDELGLSRLVDNGLGDFSLDSRGAALTYMPENVLTDTVYSIRGKYTVRAGQVFVNFAVYKGQKQRLFSLQERGTLRNKEALAKEMVDKVNRYLNRQAADAGH
ncbi:MAG: caspase family protein [Puia sp.]|nr:caspase family protein [Puia sp.]